MINTLFLTFKIQNKKKLIPGYDGYFLSENDY